MSAPAGERFDRLVEIMRALRAPDGCPWDREQTQASLRPFVLEETYEVLEAIEHGGPAQLCEELGDKHRFEQKIAELLAEPLMVMLVDRLEHLVGFLEHERPQRGERLLAVPGAPARGAQRAHDADEPIEARTRSLSHAAMVPFALRIAGAPHRHATIQS